MITIRKHWLLLLLSALFCLGQNSWAQDSQTQPPELSWLELSPPADEEIVRKYEAGEISDAEAAAYVEKLGNIPVQKLNNSRVRIPGFLVPLNVNEDQRSTELLLVPTMGACIHVPPPPPNQSIYIRYPEGIKVTEAAYTPYWVEGIIKVEKNESEYAAVLYAMTPDSIVEYE